MEAKPMSVKIKEASEFLDLKEEDLLVFVDRKILKPITSPVTKEKDQYQFTKEELVRFKKEQVRILAGVTEGKSEIFFWEKKLLILKNQLTKKKEQLAFLQTKIADQEGVVNVFLTEADRGMFKAKKKTKSVEPKIEIALKDISDSFLVDLSRDGMEKDVEGLKKEEILKKNFWSRKKRTLAINNDSLEKSTLVPKEKSVKGMKEKIKAAYWGEKWKRFFK